MKGKFRVYGRRQFLVTYLEIIESKPFVSAIVGTVLCVIATIVVVLLVAADVVVVAKMFTAILNIVKHEHNDAVRIMPKKKIPLDVLNTGKHKNCKIH